MTPPAKMKHISRGSFQTLDEDENMSTGTITSISEKNFSITLSNRQKFAFNVGDYPKIVCWYKGQRIEVIESADHPVYKFILKNLDTYSDEVAANLA
jgi:hypothetical protein